MDVCILRAELRMCANTHKHTLTLTLTHTHTHTQPRYYGSEETLKLLYKPAHLTH